MGGTHNKVSILNHAVPFNKRLLLFSEQTQFELSGGDILTPSSVSIVPTTEFATSSKARPVPAGPERLLPGGPWGLDRHAGVLHRQRRQ